MSRKRTVYYAMLNIRLHPHTTAKYAELFEESFDLKQQINLRGDTYAMLTQVSPIKEDLIDGIYGEVAKFTQIEISKWFNIKKLKAAEEKEKRKLVYQVNSDQILQVLASYFTLKLIILLSSVKTQLEKSVQKHCKLFSVGYLT